MLNNKIGGREKGIYNYSPATVPPVGMLKHFDSKSGMKVLYKKPEQTLKHENAHARFNEALVESGISDLLVIEGSKSRRVTPEQFKDMVSKKKVGYYLKTNLSEKEKYALAALNEAFAILSDGSSEILRNAELDKSRTSANYHRGEFYAAKAAKKNLALIS
ncbi:MAG: hypothetical protein QXO69_03375 [archaeon]